MSGMRARCAQVFREFSPVRVLVRPFTGVALAQLTCLNRSFASLVMASFMTEEDCELCITSLVNKVWKIC